MEEVEGNTSLDEDSTKLCMFSLLIWNVFCAHNSSWRIDSLMFWIIKGSIRARQKILGLEPVIDSEGRKACAIRFDPELVETEALPYKPIQGWRYLTVEEAPIDRPSDADSSDMPAAMRAELRALGLL